MKFIITPGERTKFWGGSDVSSEFSQHSNHGYAWRNVPGNRHGKLFIDKPCKKRADDLLKLGRHQLRMIVAILTGHAPVRKHLHLIGLFDGDPTCRFCRMEIETAQHIICHCEALARQRYNTFGGAHSRTKGCKQSLSKGPLPLYKKHRTAEPLLKAVFGVAQ